MKSIVFISIIFYNFSLIAQTPVVFVESSSRLNVKEKYFGLAKAIVDLNGDFRDDILSTGQDAFLIEVQLNNGLIFSDVYQDTIQKNAYTVNVGDFNNDGYNDFLYSGFYNGVSVYRKQEDMFSFVKSQNNEEILFAQGSSLFDINNDGWLDALMTNDDGLSLTLINDGKGNLVEEELIDFRTVPVSDNSGNYSAIWVDLNQDSRQDLYISKCRAGVTDPEDPRRINTAFINTDSGYIESAKSFKLDLGEQSWCADSGDLDNDGDMDLVVINHLDPHVIMENNGDGTFARHESFTTSGAISTPDLEVSLADFNNDGLLDILITGVKDYLLLNQGDLQFKSNDNPFGFKNASSAAVGDLNNDGYLDCYIAFGAPDSPSVFADETWLNFGGANNHFKLSLSGTQSNKSGIGSQVLLYGPWGMQTRWQNSGVAYGITNSLNIHFGLADHEVIDSLVINWPSGLSDKYVNLDVNEHYIATEGECVEKILDISYSALEIDCDNDTILLTCNNTSGELLWTNGDTLREIQINTPGYFQAESRSACRNVSPIIKLTALESPEVPIMNYSQDLILCENDQVVLSTKLDTDVLWSTDTIAANITIEDPGTYFASSYNACDTINSDTIWVEYLNQDFQDEKIILDSIQDYPLSVPGEEITWFRDSAGTEIIKQGNDILVENITYDTTVYYQNLATRDIPSFTGGKEMASSEEKYGSDEVKAGMYLTVHQKVRLLSFQTIAEVPGVRRILFEQFGESNVIGETFFAVKGNNHIQTDIILEPGNYAVGTGSNLDELGTVSPRLLVSDSDVNYPYEIDHLLTIDDSFFGEDHYFYYYDLEVEAYSEPCFSDIFVVEFVLDTTTNITHIAESVGDVLVFPNPATNILNVALETYSNGQVDIISLQGSRLMSERYSIDSGEMIELDIGFLDTGVYLVRLTGNGEVYYGRFIKL